MKRATNFAISAFVDIFLNSFNFWLHMIIDVPRFYCISSYKSFICCDQLIIAIPFILISRWSRLLIRLAREKVKTSSYRHIQSLGKLFQFTVIRQYKLYSLTQTKPHLFQQINNGFLTCKQTFQLRYHSILLNFDYY